MTRAWFWLLALSARSVSAQNAGLSGLILDPANATVSGAEVSLRNEQTGGRRTAKSSADGFYNFASLKPGEYRLSVRASGFETMIQDGIQLEVGASARIDFNLRIGDARTEVTIHAGSPLINTQDASVGTVIDRDLIDKMPLNGRGIQSLIELSPGTVVVPVVSASSGQFAINGQRSNANYFTVDGVSGNFALSLPLSTSGALASTQIGAGMVPANNFFGTYSNLAPPDSLQEFRIQTSTFAAEYGRSPGGQIGLVTRSGTNRYSGSLFEYFRNERTDATDWFANRLGSPKPPLRFNNFGGSIGGPVWIPRLYNGHDRTFFFLSVDELYTAQPQPPFTFPVPTRELRQSAPPLVAQLLNGYPLPNRPPASGTDFAEYAGSFSLSQRQHALSIRGDHTFNERWTLFARYSRSPSERANLFLPSPSQIGVTSLASESLTFGLTHLVRPNMVHDIRLNASRQFTRTRAAAHVAGGAQTPPASLLMPPGYSFDDSFYAYSVGPAPQVVFGGAPPASARQIQALDNFIIDRGPHQVKFGADYRWYSPTQRIQRLEAFASISDLYGPLGLLNGNGRLLSLLTRYYSIPNTTYLYEAFSAYVQDTWKVDRKLTLTYGLRWEVAPGIRTNVGQSSTAKGNPGEPFNFVPTGQSPYPTTWTNFAPRFGLAWQAFDRANRKTVVRIGAGKFFDLGQSGTQGQGYYGTTTEQSLFRPLGSVAPQTVCRLEEIIANGSEGVKDLPTIYPQGCLLDTAALSPSEQNPLAVAQVRVVTPNYKLPFTWQWNATVEQLIGQQSFSASYIGALGRRLTAWSIHPKSVSAVAIFYNNASSSSYHGLQLQYNRRLNSRIRMLASYTWSHSIDDLSSDQLYTFPDGGPVSLVYNPRRKGSSDFDLRHAFNGSFIASLPSPQAGIARALLRHWTATSIFFVRSAAPTDLLYDNYVHRPDVIQGQPLYLYGPQFPGGKSYNLGAFALPPDGRDGNFGRNVLRGLGAWQVDLALHREFQLSETAKLQFRAEAFNILNHPNFANPSNFNSPGILSVTPDYEGIGASTKMLSNGLNPTGTLGGLSSLFQIGGPRTMQFAVRLAF